MGNCETRKFFLSDNHLKIFSKYLCQPFVLALFSQRLLEIKFSVLLLPPVNNYRRFLIHQTCESFCQQYDLFTFSIGQGPFRRTVICFKNQLLDPIKYSTAVANSTELRKQSQVKSWRSERKPENLSVSTLFHTRKDLNFPTKMGVERNGSTDAANGSTTRCIKTTAVDIYRPPALRLQSNELSDSNSQKCDTKNDSYAKANNSISCNNSPTHANENNKICNTMALPVTVANEKSQQQVSAKPTLVATTTTANLSRRERRPDRAVYIPRARRSQTTPPATTAPQSQQTANNHVSVQQLAITSDLSSLVSTEPSSKVDELSKNCSSKKIKSTSIVGSNKERKERVKKSSTTTKHKTPYISTSEKGINNVSEEETKGVRSINTNCDNFTFKSEKENNTKFNSTNTKHIANNISENIGGDIVIEDPIPDINNSFTVVEMATSLLANQSNSNGVNTESSLSNIRIEDVIAADRTKSKCDIEQQELQRASKEINRSNRRIMKQSFISDVLEIPEKIDKHEDTKKKNQHLNNESTTTDEEDEDDWENMYDESGECLDPKILEELTTSVGKVKIELPKMDYSAYLTKQSILNDEEFPHVLEVSNFPVEFKNQDLLMLFSQYKESGFDIKWVDDTHALAVFSSSRIAAEVLTMGHPFVVLKPLAEATVESRLKAKKCAGSLQPYRPRPETCAALARRLVTGALGVRLKTAAAERENEIRVLREAKERKLLAAKQRDEVWES